MNKYALVIIGANEQCTVKVFETEKEAIFEMNEQIDAISETTDIELNYLPTIKIESKTYKRLIYAADPFVYWEQNNQTDPDEDHFYVVEIS